MKFELHILPQLDIGHDHIASSRCKCGMKKPQVIQGVKIFTHLLVGGGPDRWKIEPVTKK